MSYRHWIAGTAAAGLALAAALVACAPEEDPREDVLAYLAQAGASAAVDFADEGEALAQATVALCEAPSDAGLAQAQERWRLTRTAWGRGLVFAFGPAMEHSGALDYWPARTDTIEAAIAAAPATVDAAHVDSLGTSAKGMPALEYLLFGAGEAPAEVVAGLRAEDGSGSTRCAYAAALAGDIAARGEAIRVAWAEGFADELAGAGGDGSRYASRKEGIDAVVNRSIDTLYEIVKGRLDGPLGNLTGAPPDPEALESRFSGATVADIDAVLRGVWVAYDGADAGGEARGIAALVAAADPELNQRIYDQYGYALEATAALPSPAGAHLVEQRDLFQAARDEIDALRRLLKLDVAAALGVTLALSDNDGD
ncbi:MAG: imelysin family protein [Nannocystaceae bacterium]